MKLTRIPYPLFLSFLTLTLFSISALAQKWQQPKPADQWQKPGEIQKPSEIRVPKGEIQKPGEIQVPKGIQAIKAQQDKCQQRFAVVADALFAFNQWTLTPQAEETLNALLPMLAKAGQHPVSIEGHTDALGTDAYNQRLSEKRAQAIKAWLVAHQAVPANAALKGFGETRPVAPNANPDGSDNTAGRQRNRRVEIVLDTCH
jgi:outer membrane protein OmpA-like peptidoglycan-associated protein